MPDASHPCDAVYWRRPEWAAAGSISLFDARFLYDRAAEGHAEVAVEIGSAAGMSAAVLCHGLARAHERGRVGPAYGVVSYDMRSHHQRESSQPIGAAVHDMLDPEQARRVEFRNPATAETLGEHHGADEIGLLFIDADHRHPWPALDMLATLDLVRPGGEVILHDINLPEVAPEYAAWGAHHVFTDLDVEKHADPGADTPNVGSVIVPDDKDAFRAELLAIVHAREWEGDVPDAVTRALL